MSTLKVGAIQSTAGNAAITVASDGSLTTTQKVATSNLGTGAVLQVKQSTLGVAYYSGTDDYMSTTLSLQITPRSTSSKILLQYSASCHNDTSGGFVVTDLYKNPTSSLAANTVVSGGTFLSGKGNTGFGLAQTYGQNNGSISSCVGMFLDAPSTASLITYLVIYRNYGGGNAYFNVNNGLATFTAMEIGG